PASRGLRNLSQVGLAFGTLVFLGCLFGAVYSGLLSTPDMEVRGGGSSNQHLVWYLDRTDGSLPIPTVLTTSLWVWRLAMLCWAVWLAYNLLRWLRWAWGLFSADGLWKKSPPKPPLPPGPAYSGPAQPEPTGQTPGAGGAPDAAFATTGLTPYIPAPTQLGRASSAYAHHHWPAEVVPYSQRLTSDPAFPVVTPSAQTAKDPSPAPEPARNTPVIPYQGQGEAADGTQGTAAIEDEVPLPGKLPGGSQDP
ncbi:MAG: hypothetical protein RJA70_594, partial [Pseudomonadota bacterium]